VSTSFDIVVAEPNTRLAIYGVDGRLVTTLLDRVSPAGGATTVAWDGRDAFGARVPAGIYLARLESSRVSDTLQLVVLR